MKEITKSIVLRSIGIVLMTFIPGMGIGAVAAGGDWMMGGIIATGTSFATVVIYLGVVLAWSGNWSETDVQTAFRAAASKAAENNEDVQAALDNVKEEQL
jgi:hypothetical protein